MQMLKGKNAIVTGAARGIGEACARTFAEHGVDFLLIADWDISRAKETAKDITKEYSTRCEAVKADVSNESDVKNVYRVFSENCGRLDILLNSAGISGTAGLYELTVDSWDRTMAINLKGTFLFSREALRLMEKQRDGRIITMSSQAGKSGGILVSADYPASKGGILALTKTLAKLAAPSNITVNSVAPGLIATEMTKDFNYDPKSVPLGRIGTPQEIADVCLFLASDLSRYITGASIDVNGGILMS
jgi:3-oxoacyl-[acyl-carrier protein] reductase